MSNFSIQPLVSILIRSMDRPTLQRALDSAAAQTWPNLEIVVIAACGQAHRPLPTEYRGRPLRLVFAEPKARLSRPEAANSGLDSARGEWLNFLDDDDELLPSHLTALLTAPRQQNERVIFSRTRVVDAHRKTIGHVSHAGNHVQLYFHSRATTCSTLFERSLVEEGVRFDADFAVHEDHDFQVNCATRTEFRYVDMATCIWHAQAGDSGCGFGDNDDSQLRLDSVKKVRRKWASVFDRWLADADAVAYAGRQYLKGIDLNAANACFTQVLRLRGDDTEAKQALVTIAARRRPSQQTTDELRLRGQTYLKRGQIDDALRILEELLQLLPNDINALNLCGMANFHRSNYARAETLMLRALHLLPEHAGLKKNLQLIRARASEVV